MIPKDNPRLERHQKTFKDIKSIERHQKTSQDIERHRKVPKDIKRHQKTYGIGTHQTAQNHTWAVHQSAQHFARGKVIQISLEAFNWIRVL